MLACVCVQVAFACNPLTPLILNTPLHHIYTLLGLDEPCRPSAWVEFPPAVCWVVTSLAARLLASLARARLGGLLRTLNPAWVPRRIVVHGQFKMLTMKSNDPGTLCIRLLKPLIKYVPRSNR